jgi:exopolysaccharide production protein ExoQ
MTIPKHIVSLIRDAYFVCVLVLTIGAFASIFLDTGDLATSSQGSPYLKAVSLAIYGITIVRVFLRRYEAVGLIRENRALVFFFLLTLGSVVWSIDRSATLHTWTTLFGSTLVALDLSIHYSLEKQLRLVCVALVSVMVLSVVVELVTPGLIPGQDMEGSAWHGVFGVKNVFGKAVCLTVVACLCLLSKSVVLRFLMVGAGVALGILSQSTSSVGYLAIIVATFALLPVLKWKPTPRRFAVSAILLVTVIVVYFAVTNLESVTAALDKDPHLTGRTDLWEYAIDCIKEKPLLGYGYEAFWTYDSVPARRIREAINWDSAPHAHNGYIDLTLGVGIIGLLVYLALLTVFAKRAYVYFASGPEDYRRWPLTFLAFTFFYQFTEGTMVSAGCLWIIFCGLMMSMNSEQELAIIENEVPLQAVRFGSPLSIDIL